MFHRPTRTPRGNEQRRQADPQILPDRLMGAAGKKPQPQHHRHRVHRPAREPLPERRIGNGEVEPLCDDPEGEVKDQPHYPERTLPNPEQNQPEEKKWEEQAEDQMTPEDLGEGAEHHRLIYAHLGGLRAIYHRNQLHEQKVAQHGDQEEHDPPQLSDDGVIDADPEEPSCHDEGDRQNREP